MPAIYICPKCQTSIVEVHGQGPVDRLLILHRKTCGHLPLRMGTSAPGPTAQQNSQTFDQTIDRVAERLIEAAGDVLRRGFVSAARRTTRRRR